MLAVISRCYLLVLYYSVLGLRRLTSFSSLAHHPRSTPYSAYEMSIATKKLQKRKDKNIHYHPASKDVVASIIDPLLSGMTHEDLEKVNETNNLSVASIKMRKAMVKQATKRVMAYQQVRRIELGLILFY